MAEPPRPRGHVSHETEAPVPPDAITVMIGVPGGGTPRIMAEALEAWRKRGKENVRRQQSRRVERDGKRQPIHVRAGVPFSSSSLVKPERSEGREPRIHA